jgi:hypothetical protein
MTRHSDGAGQVRQLRQLDCAFNNMSAAFARNVLLPTVHRNVSLRKLVTGRTCSTAHNLEALVRGRGAA